MSSKICAIFPGQGSQSVGMLADLAEQHTVIKETFAEASDILSYDLWQLVSEDPNQQINLTEYTQPAMLVSGVACWRLFNHLAPEQQPVLMAGHSLGEWSALVAAGAIAFEDAVRLVQKRAQLMQSAVPAEDSAMAAILGLEDQQVVTLCEQATEASQGPIVEAVNFNSPGQVVVAGNKAAVDKLIQLATEAGAKRALPLSVSVPSHSSLLQGAGQALAEAINIDLLNAPSIPVIHNVDAKTHTDTTEIRDIVSAQIYKPVLWVDCVQHAITAGVDTFIEIGPGKVLAGLCKRIDRKLNIATFDSSAGVEKTLASLVEA